MYRIAKVFFSDIQAGILSETDEGYTFKYLQEYLSSNNAKPISFTLPLKSEVYLSKTMFSFFDGLIPEGWLLDIAVETWKINHKDRMGLLLACCKDCIGAISIIKQEEK